MTNPELAILMLGSFIFIILLGFPIAFTLMAMGVGFGYYAYFRPDQAFFDNRVFYLFTQNTFSVMNNDVLVAVPMERPARIVELQLLVLHCLCDAVDFQLMGEQDT